MSKKAKVQVHVGGLEDMGRRFVDAWKRAEADTLRRAERHITFRSLEALLSALTPKRWELLRNLRGRGPASVRALALRLRRDYKRVHTDVAELERIGLVERDTAGQVCVVWDAVDASLSLAA